jgi:hypothetical protein
MKGLYVNNDLGSVLENVVEAYRDIRLEAMKLNNLVRIVDVQTNIRSGDLPNAQDRNVTAGVNWLCNIINAKQPQKPRGKAYTRSSKV